MRLCDASPTTCRGLIGLVILLGHAVAIAAQDLSSKAPVPDAAARENALKIFRELYAGEYDRAKTATDKAALGAKILEQATQAKDDPASHYVLLQAAKDLAIQAGDVDTALAAAGDMAKAFQIDALKAKAETMVQLSSAVRSTAQARSFIQGATKLIDEAIAEDDYELAEQIASIARPAVPKARDKTLWEKLRARAQASKEISEAYSAYKKTLAILKANPVDPEANLAAGRFLCLIKGDWQKGLPMLALSRDAACKPLAATEIRGVYSKDDKLALADGWWKLAEQETGRAAKHLRIRAAAWYQHLLPELSGLAEAKAKKRIAEVPHPIPDIHDLYTPFSPKRFYGDKRILLIFVDKELKVAEKACKKYGLKYDAAPSYDVNRADYSDYHTIVSGSNAMDYWGTSDERKRPEAFRHVEAFVNDGGHLIVLGSFNGRNNEHLRRFGIRTSHFHNNLFEPAGEATRLLFQGNEDVVPEDRHLRSAGNFSISVAHTVLLKRGEGRYPGQPALATLEHNKGRVTLTMCEPMWQNDFWLIPVLLFWTARGCPTPGR